MKTFPVAALILGLLFFVAVIATCSRFVCAQTEHITIRADGSISPQTAQLTQTGNVYRLTGNVSGGITVEKFGIVLDGAGYTLQGDGTGRGIQISNTYNATTVDSYDVTVKNFNVAGFEEGIAVFGYWGNIISGVTIAGNNVTHNDVGVRFSSYSRYFNNTVTKNWIIANTRGVVMEMGHVGDESGNAVTSNYVADNQEGMWFLWLGDYYGDKPELFEMNTHIYDNSFVDNSRNVVNAHVIYDPDCANIWDNSARGNYWGYYNGTDSNSDGIGDTPYIIDANNQDRYPLMNPVVAPPPSPSPSAQPEPEPFATLLVATGSIAAGALIAVAVLVYFKKNKKNAKDGL